MPPAEARRSSSKISRGTREGEALLPAQRPGDVLDDAPVLPGLAGRIDRLVDLDDAAFDLVTVPSSSSCSEPGSTMSA